MSDDSDWSDSDVELDDGIETSVLLGVPDGLVKNSDDLSDVAVSRIGGHPAFLTSKEPPFESCECLSCRTSMELLVQLWCPFEDSPMDRALYVWGCAKKDCQSKKGSVRAWRGLRYNAPYATKLEEKRLKKEQEATRRKAEEEQAQKPKPNPFSASSAPSSSPFGFGSQIFGAAALTSSEPTVKEAPPEEQSSVEVNPIDEEEQYGSLSEEDGDSSESLITALATTYLSSSPWSSAPHYPPFYLSTAAEYAPGKSQDELRNDVENSGENRGTGTESWASEAYENSLTVDQTFERFTRRVAWEAEQCVRYELAGIPLPFSSDSIFALLFPATSPTEKRQYVSPLPTTLVPRCESCQAERVFECQIMPNLNNILRKNAREDELVGLTEKERVDRIKNTAGMDWGTCLIFSCSKDCCLENGKDAKDCWREEVVLIQQDE
jgi:pre-rRNA-processing protein TSR4